jgi:putative PEP-CTERM system TPR-repeat lipoprotein
MPRSSKQFALAALISSAAVLTGCHHASTESLLADARQYAQKGDHKAALIQLKNAVANSPDAPAARLALADEYSVTGDMVSAEKEYRKALSLNAPKDQVLLPLAKTLLAQGQFQKALDETADRSASSAELTTLRGEAYLGLNDPAHAKEAVEAALKLKPDHAPALIGMARWAMSQNDLAGATAYADSAIAKNPRDAEALFFKGAMLRAAGKPEEAIAVFDQVVKLDPAHRFAYVEKAALEIALNKLDAARVDLDAAKKQNPNTLQVLYTEALLDFTKGNSKGALELLQKVLRVAPEHYPSVLLAGAAEANTGATEQATAHLRQYLEKFPTNTYARKLLASTLIKTGQAPDALAVIGPALKENANDPQLLALAGQGYLEARDFGKASEYFDKASKLAPNAVGLHTSLGLSRLGAGDSEEAVKELEKAAAMDDKGNQAGMALVRTELGLKHYDKALAAVARMEQAHPNDPQVINVRGGVLLAKHDLAGARAAFEKAAALKADFFGPVANLAQLDLMDRHPEAAQQRLQAFLAKNPKSSGAMTTLGALAAKQNQPAQAIGWLEKAQAANPDDVGAALRLGSAYLKNGDKARALTLMRKLQTTNPMNPDVLDLLGQIQVASADLAGALDTYSKLVNVLPKAPLAQMRLASVHMLAKNDSLAADDLKKALELDPNFLEARLAQVEMAMRHNKPDEAQALAAALQKQRPTLPVGFAVEGDVAMAQHQYERAAKAYEQAWNRMKAPQLNVKLITALNSAGKTREADARLAAWRKESPDDPAAAMMQADRLLAAKSYREAVPLLESVLKQSPDQAAALNNLAYAYGQLKDARAEPTAERAFKLDPHNPEINDTLAWMLTERGDVKRALPMLRMARALAPNRPEIGYHLAAALAKSGDKAGAKKELDAVLAAKQSFAEEEQARALQKQL